VNRDLVLRREAIETAKENLWMPARSEGVDPVVRASWQRCAPGLETSITSAPVDPAEDTRERWDECLIRRAVPGLVAQLEQAAVSGDLIACITDADGRVLWQWTPRWLRPGADRIGLTPGGIWHEGSSGTNGIGLALAADRPVTVFATEHWLTPVSDWVCYGAPVHGRDGTQLGVIDLSTSWKRANPLALITVASMARLIEHELRTLDRSPAELAEPELDLRVMGDPVARLDGRSLHLTQRQYEILTILALTGGATLDALHARLYGDRPVSLATLKVEMSHLRRALEGHLTSRPYRLTLPVQVDAIELEKRLGVGDVDGAARLYAGQLLPASEAPLLVEQRHHIDVALRTALLRGGTPSSILRFCAVHPHDVEVLRWALQVAGPDDPLVPAVSARLAVAALG
jgi:transcriptional regulator of acetoin/glycerol metabolism